MVEYTCLFSLSCENVLLFSINRQLVLVFQLLLLLFSNSLLEYQRRKKNILTLTSRQIFFSPFK